MNEDVPIVGLLLDLHPDWLVARTTPPDTMISLDDFEAHAKEVGCQVRSQSKETYIGPIPSGGGNQIPYPHIHVWRDGNIALSVAHRTNQKVGAEGQIDIKALAGAYDRYKQGYFQGKTCIKQTIEWVLASAS